MNYAVSDPHKGLVAAILKSFQGAVWGRCQEIRRRERVIRIFPNEASALRLIGALLAEKQQPGAQEKNI